MYIHGGIDHGVGCYDSMWRIDLLFMGRDKEKIGEPEFSP